MSFGNASDIEELEGISGEPYNLTHYYEYPFKPTINNIKALKHKNCLCVALTRGKGKTSNHNLIGYKIEYLENLDFNTYNNKLDINQFECMGLGVIENLTEAEAEKIIKDLKANSYFYVKRKSDLD